MTSGLQNGDLVSLTMVDDALPGMKVEIGKRTSTRQGGEQPMEAAGNTAEPVEDSAPDQTSSQQERDGIAAA